MIPEVLVVGGGMITHDQILPSLLQLQRDAVIAEITVVSSKVETIRKLADAPIWERAFPGQSFRAFPRSGEKPQPKLYRELIDRMMPGNIVIIALPDQMHFDAVMYALKHDQHVVCVKPLVMTANEAALIETEARSRGLFVGIEYHKRFDDRSLMARRRYRAGLFGDFRLGNASLMEKWYYRRSNFQNWCTTDNSDAFAYIGCHYVDLVHFITALLPTSVSVYGIAERYPNGNEGFLWADARVLWSNGACLNVQNTLSFPDDGPGSNMQHLTMYCSKGDRGAMLRHSDQYRGIEYCYIEQPAGEGATAYSEPSPDYFQYVDVGGGVLTPVGYGYRSVEHLIKKVIQVAESGDLASRQRYLKDVDDEGVLATPANSRYNEFVMEAGRLSILNGAREAVIDYATGKVDLR